METIKEPKFPPCRIIEEGNEWPLCEKCGSSLKKRFRFFGKVYGCIQPECENYYKNNKDWQKKAKP